MELPYTFEGFAERYPEFAALDERAMRACLEDADHAHAGVTAQPCRRQLTELLAAHWLALRFDISAKAAELGLRDPYAAIQAGGSYSASTSSVSISGGGAGFQSGNDPYTAGFGRTAYGLEYMLALNRCVAPGGVLLSADTSDTLGGGA